MAKVSPLKAQRFLSQLASQRLLRRKTTEPALTVGELQVEAEFDEGTASKFYRFVGAKQIAHCESRQEVNL